MRAASVPTFAFTVRIVTSCLCVWILLIDVVVTPKANAVYWFKHVFFFLAVLFCKKSIHDYFEWFIQNPRARLEWIKLSFWVFIADCCEFLILF